MIHEKPPLQDPQEISGGSFHTSTSNISDWSDTKEVLNSMNTLFDEACQGVIGLLMDIADK